MFTMIGREYEAVRERLAEGRCFPHLKLRGGGGKFQKMVGLTAPAVIEWGTKDEKVPQAFIDALTIIPESLTRDEFIGHMIHTAKLALSDDSARTFIEFIQDATQVTAVAKKKPKIPTPGQTRPTVELSRSTEKEEPDVEEVEVTPTASKKKGVITIQNYTDLPFLVKMHQVGNELVIEMRDVDSTTVETIPAKYRGEYKYVSPGHRDRLCGTVCPQPGGKK